MHSAPDLADQLLRGLDRSLRAVLAPARASRPVPGTPGAALEEAQRRESAALMRINHAGEMAAQGLYHGQSLVARDEVTRAQLERAAREETDHLAWCQTRLKELGSRPSFLDPFWYAGSFVIGAVAGLAGDRLSLGFVAETERQVEAHLDSHLEQVPASDARSRAILDQMRADEIEHGRAATAAGGGQLPAPLRSLMRATARIMTTTARRV